jgi:HD-GYP domain-containing protein (c-di-GMP phosphodiesterase class II)
MARPALENVRSSLASAAPDPVRPDLAGTLAKLIERLEEREHDAARHARDVAALAVDIAERIGLSGDETQQIRVGALLHDIGKLAVPDEILSKPGPLTEREWALMRGHPSVGEAVLEPIFGRNGGVAIAFARAVLMIVRSHHERWDGDGYPDRLAADEIPLGARIVAVADAFQAMIERRPYRNARSREDAMAEVVREAGRQFDPESVASLLAVATAP